MNCIWRINEKSIEDPQYVRLAPNLRTNAHNFRDDIVVEGAFRIEEGWFVGASSLSLSSSQGCENYPPGFIGVFHALVFVAGSIWVDIKKGWDERKRGRNMKYKIFLGLLDKITANPVYWINVTRPIAQEPIPLNNSNKFSQFFQKNITWI